jgi:hypothetical protein
MRKVGRRRQRGASRFDIIALTGEGEGEGEGEEGAEEEADKAGGVNEVR